MEWLALEEETETLHVWRFGFLGTRFQAGFFDASWLAPWLPAANAWVGVGMLRGNAS